MRLYIDYDFTHSRINPTGVKGFYSQEDLFRQWLKNGENKLCNNLTQALRIRGNIEMVLYHITGTIFEEGGVRGAFSKLNRLREKHPNIPFVALSDVGGQWEKNMLDRFIQVGFDYGAPKSFDTIHQLASMQLGVNNLRYQTMFNPISNIPITPFEPDQTLMKW